MADLGVAEMASMVFEVPTDVGWPFSSSLSHFISFFEEKVGKKKKKKRSEDNNIDVSDASHPESVDKSMKNTTTQEVLAGRRALEEGEKKEKKTEEKSEIVDPIDNDNNDLTGETTKKDKKKKSKEKNGATDSKDSKDSKKRKRSTFDENENQGVDGVGTEESKHRKTEGLEELKSTICQSGNQEQNGKIVEANSNGNHKSELNNFAKQKSSRKAFNGSAEDGADIDYGAKAQEALGQVKGRIPIWYDVKLIFVAG
ncbi:hypothetical protein HAX54_038650 [Datura stramonium]|uniref:Uncharacterized protein n=1 Tax=Datura stramonium TaxID=4076 RepID=A0ABS8SI91_DATST|nr:hypothetical protein [Datura stramonium]